MASTSVSSVSMAVSRPEMSVDRVRSPATSGPSGLAPPLICSPICFDAVFRSRAEAVGLTLELAPAGVGGERGIDKPCVLALVDRALPDRVRLLAQPLQPDAHPPSPP